MKTIIYISFFLLIVTITSKAETPIKYPEGFKPQSKKLVSFKENKGQVSDQNYKPRPDILFSGTDGKLVYHLKNNGISYQLSRVDKWVKQKNPKQASMCVALAKEEDVPEQTTIYRLDINWLNANSNVPVKKENVLPGSDNYYTDVCPNGVHDVKSYSQITYQNIYSGINLKWFEKEGNLKYDYIISAGANYKDIQLELKGAEEISVNKKGELVIKTPLGKLIEQTPLVIQNGLNLDAKWIVKNNIVSFEIENLNSSLPFVIDPLVRLWGTYYGGTDEDLGSGCSIDPSGNVFLAGCTKSPNALSIATVGSHQTTYGGGGTNGDGFLVKFNSAGVRQWATYYGGAGSDFVNLSATDPFGNVYISGGSTSSASVMTTPGCHQPVFGGGGTWGDAFLAKFDGAGNRLWSTFYGANGDDWGIGCSCDGAGNVFLVGGTPNAIGSSTALTTPGAHQTTHGGSYDAFLVKFNPVGVRQWATFYGGTNYDNGISCKADAAGNVCLGGWTQTTNGFGIVTAGCHQPAFGGGGGDGYLAVFNSSGVRQWGTYYGGTGWDYGWWSDIDPSGNIYYTGYTASMNGISTPGSHQSVYGGGSSDAFLVKFNSSGAQQWGTYYGGTGNEDWEYVSCDFAGNIYLGGSTASAVGTVIATPCTYQFIYGGGTTDAFLTKFNSSGIRLWGTYYGGPSNDDGIPNTDNVGNVYLVGSTTAPSNTIIPSTGAHQTTYGGGTYDAYIVKFDGCIPQPPPDNTPLPNLTVCTGSTTVLNTTLTCGINWYNIPSGGISLSTNSTFTTPVLTNTTSFFIEELSCGPGAPRTPVTVSVIPLPIINISSSDSIICQGQNSILSATGVTNYTWVPLPSLSSVIGGTVSAFPTSTSIYSVSGDNGVCTSAQTTIQIQVISQPTINVTSQNTFVCQGSGVSITASGAQTYSWDPSTGLSSTTGSVITASPLTNATYTVIGYVTIGSATCQSQSDISLNVIPYAQPVVSNSVMICEGDNSVINASGGNTYNWSPTTGIIVDNGSSIIVSPSVTTLYTVSVSNNGLCASSATVLAFVNPNPTVDAGRDTTFNLDEPMYINAVGTGTLTWIYGNGIWCKDCPLTPIYPTYYSCYIVEVVNEFGCRAQDMVCVDITKEYTIYIPNAFSPNGDGINEVFYVYGDGLNEISLRIYDRWGEQVYYSKDQLEGWNGTNKGSKCEMGVYVYKLAYESLDGIQHSKTGHISLIK